MRPCAPQAARDESLLPVSFEGRAIDQDLAEAVLEDQPLILQAFRYATQFSDPHHAR